MSEFNYLREKARYLKSIGRNGKTLCYGADCSDCILGEKNNGTQEGCNYLEFLYPDKATNLIKNWAESHPVITNADKFKEVFRIELKPSANLPRYCLLYKDDVIDENFKWLNEEYKGGE